ncbi:Lrp/AsnC ligand binding domain-containing protein [Actinobacillus vicugnae]|uniref:Lrp/AsnC ligand binding domain-containing protein n=1 Tax=Actinobacillus vicugnae TaxID=2573093 RepID=UPI001FCBA0BA|nr:Lrp/AsnC ligand binding domain-containing protein [Actinobacillus vicugnae]
MINDRALGLGFGAVLFVQLKGTTQEEILAFEQALTDVKEIAQAQRLFGEPDYLLHVHTADLTSYQRLYDEKLSNLPNVARITSTLVMKELDLG